MKKLISILIILLCGVPFFAQSSDSITELLETEKVNFGQVCYFSAVQQNLIPETADYSTAVEALYEKGQLPAIYDKDELIPIIDVAYIFSYMWNIKGGLMYRLTKGSPRYVFKQFQSDGIIDAYVQPGSFISGAEVLSMYTSCLRKYGDFDITKVNMEAE